MNKHRVVPTAPNSGRREAAEIEANVDNVPSEAAPKAVRNRVTSLIAALVAAMGLVVLVGGWALGWEFLTRAMPGMESMKANTALCFSLAGTALWLAARESPGRRGSRLARALAAMAGIVGLATLVQYVAGVDLHIDQLLFADTATTGPYPGRMAPAAALSFVLLSFSLLTLGARSWAAQAAGDGAALAAGFLGQVALIGYLYGVNQLYQLAGFNAIALHSSIAIIALAVAIVLARDRSPLSRILLSKGVVGNVTRHLLGVTILTLVLLGQLRLVGQGYGLYDTEFGLALYVTVVITVLTSVVLWNASILRRFELAERRASQTARLRGDQYERLVANVPGGVFTRQLGANGTSRFSYLSPQFREIFGIDPADALENPKVIFDRIHPDERAAFFASIADSARTFSPWQREFRIVGPRGEIRWLRSQAAPYRTPTGNLAWDGIVLDITENKNRAEQLLQAQKMEAVGQLTGGVAHDFNNLLTVILGNAEILHETLSGNPKLQQLAETTSKAAQRGADLTRSLLAFSRKQALDPKAVDVADLVRRMDLLLRRALGEQVEINLELAKELWKATVDPAHLEAAILNLAVNARDAMPNGGRLTIEAANVELDQAYASQNVGVVSGPYVMVAVSDTGTGMTPEVMARAFDPFFTTKEVGKGSGLGLSMVYGFIKQSNGHVKIYSEPGHGTVVKLYLPRSAAIDRVEAAPSGKRPLSGGRETVLMVEDDDLVRSHVGDQLSALGYQMLLARNGPEALEILRQNRNVDLLFTDVVMPGGMTGRQLAEEARRMRPGLKVLFTSGYTDNAIIHHGKLDPGIELLSKPYTRMQLAARVRAVLDA